MPGITVLQPKLIGVGHCGIPLGYAQKIECNTIAGTVDVSCAGRTDVYCSGKAATTLGAYRYTLSSCRARTSLLLLPRLSPALLLDTSN